jgi:hypothetical protein
MCAIASFRHNDDIDTTNKAEFLSVGNPHNVNWMLDTLFPCVDILGQPSWMAVLR